MRDGRREGVQFFDLDWASGVPAFKQIMDQVKFLVACGRLHAGEALPATRRLAAHLGINPMTVSKAYRYLEKEEVVRYRPGRPVIVRQLVPGAVGREKEAQLRRYLAPVVLVVRQLGMGVPEAVSLFRDLLTREEKVPEQSAADAPRAPSVDGWQNW